MHGIAHGGARTHVREFPMKVDCGRKIPCRTGESNLRRQRAGPTLHQLSYRPPSVWEGLCADAAADCDHDSGDVTELRKDADETNNNDDDDDDDKDVDEDDKNRCGQHHESAHRHFLIDEEDEEIHEG